MMFRQAIFLAAACALILAVGCSTASNTVLLPEKGGKYQVIAFGSSETEANKSAVAKATDVCNQSAKTMVVLNHASTYQGGMAKGDKELLKFGSEIASLIDDSDLSVDTSSAEDYKVVLEFACQ